MEILHRKHRPDHPIVSGATTSCPVLLSPGLAEIAPTLSDLLGPDFAVSTERIGTGGVMVTGPVGPVGVAFLRASYPGVRLLVVDRRWAGRRTGEAVIHLEAGADGYLSSPTIAEVASHVQALSRRTSGHASAA
jgi:hypothetical protein